MAWKVDQHLIVKNNLSTQLVYVTQLQDMILSAPRLRNPCTSGTVSLLYPGKALLVY